MKVLCCVQDWIRNIYKKMNKRTEKKLYKQTLIKVRKLHPKQGDVICLQPNFDCIDIDTVVRYLKAIDNSKILGEASLIMIPFNIKNMDKEVAQMYINKSQSIIDHMGE